MQGPPGPRPIFDAPVFRVGTNASTTLQVGTGTVYSLTAPFTLSTPARVVVTAQVQVQVPSPAPSRVNTQLQLETSTGVYAGQLSDLFFFTCPAPEVGCSGSYNWGLTRLNAGSYQVRLRVFCSGSNFSPRSCDTAVVNGKDQALTVMIVNE